MGGNVAKVVQCSQLTGGRGDRLIGTVTQQWWLPHLKGVWRPPSHSSREHLRAPETRPASLQFQSLLPWPIMHFALSCPWVSYNNSSVPSSLDWNHMPFLSPAPQLMHFLLQSDSFSYFLLLKENGYSCYVVCWTQYCQGVIHTFLDCTSWGGLGT